MYIYTNIHIQTYIFSYKFACIYIHIYIYIYIFQEIYIYICIFFLNLTSSYRSLCCTIGQAMDKCIRVDAQAAVTAAFAVGRVDNRGLSDHIIKPTMTESVVQLCRK